MKFISYILGTMFFCGSVYAYQEGTYSCPNSKGVPNNIYKIKNVSLFSNGPLLPYIHFTSFFQTKPKGPVQIIEVKGIATVIESEGKIELKLDNIYLSFENARLVGCEFTH